MGGEVPTNSAFCRNILVISVLSMGFSLGYAFTCLNPVIPVLRKVYNSTYQMRYGEEMPSSQWVTLLSLTMSMIIAGGFCGSVTVNYVLKLFTRKRAMIFSSMLIITGAVIISAISGTTGSYEAFIVGRFVMGYALGVGMNSAHVVVAEYSAQSVQATYQSMFGIAISIAGIVGPIIGHPQVLGADGRWPAVVALSCVLPLIYICLTPWIPESPYTLLRQNKRDKAVELVKKMRIGDEDAIEAEIRAMEREQAVDFETKGNSQDKLDFVSIAGVLKKPQYRRQLFVVAMLYVGAMVTGINHATLFSDQIFIRGGIPADIVTYATIGVFCAQAMSAFVGMKLITIVGSRNLLLGSSCITIVSHIITTTSLATRYLSTFAGYISIIGILLLLVSYSGGPNVAIYALAGELTIEPTRQTILNYSGGLLWFTAWLTGFAAPYLDESMGPYSFLVWCGCTIIFLLFVYFFVPDTRGKTSAEIQKTLLKISNN